MREPKSRFYRPGRRADTRPARLYPGFRIKLAAADATAAVRARLEADNGPVYAAFQAWWQGQQSEPQLDAQLQGIQGS
ncbi:MAG TPA: hypothetical protein VJU61_18490 [Polyangiaceae bacterium]|nr:hypothetical protein [Polyangiaceae bacterium]